MALLWVQGADRQSGRTVRAARLHACSDSGRSGAIRWIESDFVPALVLDFVHATFTGEAVTPARECHTHPPPPSTAPTTCGAAPQAVQPSTVWAHRLRDVLHGRSHERVCRVIASRVAGRPVTALAGTRTSSQTSHRTPHQVPGSAGGLQHHRHKHTGLACVRTVVQQADCCTRLVQQSSKPEAGKTLGRVSLLSLGRVSLFRGSMCGIRY